MIGIYARISSDEQSQYSLSDQLDQCKKLAKTNEVVEYVDEGVTGSILERPALTRLRDDIREGIIDKVICWDPDRLARNLMHQLIIVNEIEKHAELDFVNHSYTKSAEGALFFQMRGAISEFEKAKITQRTSSGRIKKAKMGKVVKNSQMYGYDFDKEKSTYIINEKEAEIVKLIFDLFTKPNNKVKGINGIAIYLTETGVPTKRGSKRWHRQVVRQMLLNEAYTGDHVQYKWNTEGMVGNKYKNKEDRVSVKLRDPEEWIYTSIPKIVDRDQYEHAQQLLSESRRRFVKESLNSYLLSGLVRCGLCGNTMTGRISHNWGSKVPSYSDEKNTAGAKHRGCGNRIYAKEIEPYVWDSVLNWLNNIDEIAASAEEEVNHSFEEVEIERLVGEIEKIRTKRKNLIKLFSSLEDESDQEDVKDEMKSLSDTEKKINEKINTLKHQLTNVKNKEYSKKIFIDAAQYYLNQGLEELNFEDKQAIIRTVVQEVRVFKDRIDIYTF